MTARERAHEAMGADRFDCLAVPHLANERQFLCDRLTALISQHDAELAELRRERDGFKTAYGHAHEDREARMAERDAALASVEQLKQQLANEKAGHAITARTLVEATAPPRVSTCGQPCGVCGEGCTFRQHHEARDHRCGDHSALAVPAPQLRRDGAR